MKLLNKFSAVLLLKCKKLTRACAQLQQFQKRIWIVSIQQSSERQNTLLNDTFLVNEDSFHCSLQWMKARGYSAEHLNSVNNMQRSQTLKLELENSRHSLLRVK